MRMLIMGSGGIGGYYGARLAEAGNEVVFTARGAHLDAMQARGLEVREREGEENTRILPVTAVRYPADAGGTFDLILFTVKSYDNAEAAEAVKPVVGPETTILPLQNGVDAVDDIGGILGAEHMLAGSTDMNSRLEGPGIVHRVSRTSRLTAGEPYTPRSERAVQVIEAFQAAGIDDGVVTDDSQRALWEKFMFLAPIATANSATGLPTGHIMGLPEGRDMVLGMQREVRAVGQASGVNLPDEAADRITAMLLNLPDWHTVSMQRDFEAGRRVELETLTGSVVRRGQRQGVPTPIFSTLYPVLRARALSYGGVV